MLQFITAFAVIHNITTKQLYIGFKEYYITSMYCGEMCHAIGQNTTAIKLEILSEFEFTKDILMIVYSSVFVWYAHSIIRIIWTRDLLNSTNLQI